MAKIQKLPEESAALAPLKWVDPAVFMEGSNGQPPQPLCNFVLALALFYNDLKDVTYGERLLRQNAPEGKFQVRHDWGAHNGIDHHIYRYIIGILYELAELIKDNKGWLSEPVFREVLKSLRPAQQKDWKAITDASLDRSNSNPISQVIMAAKRVRTDVSFHYVGGAVFSGYKQFFFSGKRKRPEQERAYISLGDNMQQTRFYFADAAAQSYTSLCLKVDTENWFNDIWAILQGVNFCILTLIRAFIEARGFRIEEV